ncbi:HEXXH motif domain-containing protein [[Actinomadura] parvosata]|uniref:HEXXH motif domain-containing protein n=1 Tax=[Actinomadura] parvosata TaxID=1955412 RepID=UPI00406CFA27
MWPILHRIPDDILSLLSHGGGGPQAIALLRRIQRSKHRLLILGVVDGAARGDHRHAEAVEQAYERLVEIERCAPQAVESVICYPAVGAWGRQVVEALSRDEPPPCDPARLGSVAAAAAVRAKAACEVRVPVSEGRVHLPSLGTLRVAAADGLALLRVDDAGRIAVAGREISTAETSPGWDMLCRLRAEANDRHFTVLLDDLDPYRWPAPTALESRLPEDDLRALRVHLATAWRILVDGHRNTADEVASIVSVLTPIQPPKRGQNSASSRDLFGTVALSPPADGLKLAETLAHELQHAKLSALLDATPLTLPDDGGRHYAPWRDDPRPVSGLLQGAYAYLGVSGFWRRQRLLHERGEQRLMAETRFARWRAAAYEVAGTLSRSGRLTPAGERFVAGMRSTLEPWLDEPVPPQAHMAARHEADVHRERWRAAHASVTAVADRSPGPPGRS